MQTAFSVHISEQVRNDMPDTVVSVKQLNLYVKSLLEGNSRLAYISVCGEISNFKCHFASGHMYFTLKDDSASLKCVMFKGNALRLRFVPEDGMKVICSGRISVYERDGVYQLYAENMVPDGEGDLMAALERIKEKLSAEGLFDLDRKKPIPLFPKRVAVITSESGAAIRDIMNVLGRRYPLCDILLCPATVQGALAPQSLINALDKVSKTDAEVIIIGRGGGSIEDLWCFNDERLARRIAAMSIPVISAVGHETDFTICDFVADLRAPTPSAAAELAVPDREELLSTVSGYTLGMKAAVGAKLSQNEKMLAAINASGVFASPTGFICDKRALMLDSVSEKIKNRAEKNMNTKEAEFTLLASRLETLSPVKTMLRGFNVAVKEDKTVNSVEQIKAGDDLTLRFFDGRARCTINDIYKEQNDG